jgi:hypothetical protein
MRKYLGTGSTNKKKQSPKDKQRKPSPDLLKRELRRSGDMKKTPRATRTPGKLKGSKVMYGYKKGGQV